MSEMSERARSRAKEKVERITAKTSGAVDASGWTEPTDEKGDVQTGPRPISRRQFKAGGKVSGEGAKKHAGRKPRASGGGGWKAGVNGYSDHNSAAPSVAFNKLRDASMRPVYLSARESTDKTRSPELAPARKPRKSGGALTADSFINRDVKEANEERAGSKHIGGMKKGGRAGKMGGGASCGTPAPVPGRPMQRPMMRKMGGAIPDGTRPKGGRIARAKGGRAKGKMNVNIIISTGPKPSMPPPGMVPPPPGGGPVGLHQGIPPQMPPAGAAPPMGPPPMGRKSGGRAYPIESGAGGGLGRLEKARAYG